MKTIGMRCLVAALFCASALLVFGNDLKSAIIAAGGTLSINVPGNHFLVIKNFTQEGGTSRGVVTVTDNNALVANVLAAAIVDTSTPAPLEVINSVVIAGPASVSVTCAADATNCFVSYRKDNE